MDVSVGGIDALDAVNERYDVITLSHVIEHVGDPNDALLRLQGALKPGGRLWLETPNLGSLGYRLFGRNWRGLEPPRHLVLFNPRSLRESLARAGFCDVHQRWDAMVSFDVLRASAAIRDRRPVAGAGAVKKGWPREFLIECIEALWPPGREFLTFTATTRGPERVE